MSVQVAATRRQPRRAEAQDSQGGGTTSSDLESLPLQHDDDDNIRTSWHEYLMTIKLEQTKSTLESPSG